MFEKNIYKSAIIRVMEKFQNISGKFFKDKEGKIIIGQLPNIPIISWFLFYILSILEFLDKYSQLFNYLSTAFLFTWAYLELTQGVNYFRRFLGFVVIIFIIYNWL